MRITAYADRLIDDLDALEWPESIKTMQRNWIGRSEGAGSGSRSAGGAVSRSSRPGPTRCSAPPSWCWRRSTRWSTRCCRRAGPTAPDARGPATPRARGGGRRVPAAAARKTDRERQESREKTGVFTGAYATNPATGEPIPIFVADYVLMGYGTGAIMAVPGQDERDWEFATAFELPIVRTVQPPEGSAGGRTPAKGRRSTRRTTGASTGFDVAAAKRAITDWLVGHDAGEAVVHVQAARLAVLAAALLGRAVPDRVDRGGRRHGPVAVDEAELPVVLPDVQDYSPPHLRPRRRGQRARAAAVARGGVGQRRAGLGRAYRRETNTMPQWAGSCWYYLRYLDPDNHERFVDPEVERYWMGQDPARPGDPGGVDLYVGGVEHAVLHLLYARFWHKVLYDLGHVSSEEPFRRLFNQGYIQAYAYTRRPRRVRPGRRGHGVRRRWFHAGTGSRSPASTGRWASRCATSSRPTRCARATERTRSGCTRCRPDRWTSPGRGRPATSSARSGSCSGCGATWSTSGPASCGCATTSRSGPRRCGSCTARSPACARTTWRCTTTPRSPS